MDNQPGKNLKPNGDDSHRDDKNGSSSHVEDITVADIPLLSSSKAYNAKDPDSHRKPFADNGTINLQAVSRWVDLAIRQRVGPALPSVDDLEDVRFNLVHDLPPSLQHPSDVFQDLLRIPTAVSSAKLSKHYYGFVSGSTLPIAEAANQLVSAMDLNVMVHDANTSVAVDIEAATLQMLLQLLDLPEADWQGRTLTTGATGSNILALAAARDTLVNRLLERGFPNRGLTVASRGLVGACAIVGVRNVKILSQKAHSSVYKAAGILGLGRGCVSECGLKDEPWKWDWEKVQAELDDEVAICIAVVSCGEVDTGRYGTEGEEDMRTLRGMMDLTKHGGWIHVDGGKCNHFPSPYSIAVANTRTAFGIFGRCLPISPEFAIQRAGCSGLEYADSIGADAHKLLNVPYETAFLFTRHASSLTDICSNGSAAYLATVPAGGIISPLNTSLENSRRFRTLPIYAVLLNLGRSGLAQLFASQILLARAIATHLHEQYSEEFELLPVPKQGESFEDQLRQVGIIVLFRAKDEELNKVLTDRINSHKDIFVSGTSYRGKKAVRIAVSGWDIDYIGGSSSDVAVICGVLDRVLEEWKEEQVENEKAWEKEVEEIVHWNEGSPKPKKEVKDIKEARRESLAEAAEVVNRFSDLHEKDGLYEVQTNENQDSEQQKAANLEKADEIAHLLKRTRIKPDVVKDGSCDVQNFEKDGSYEVQNKEDEKIAHLLKKTRIKPSQEEDGSCEVQGYEQEGKPSFDTISDDEQEQHTATLHVEDVAKQADQQRKRSIVYVSDHGMAPATRVASHEAQEMREAFASGAPTFLAQDVGDTGALEPSTNLKAPLRCERERESARIKSARGSNSPYTVHASRMPVVPHSPLTAPVDGDYFDEDISEIQVNDLKGEENGDVVDHVKENQTIVENVNKDEIKKALDAGISPFSGVVDENSQQPSYSQESTEKHEIEDDEGPKGRKTQFGGQDTCSPTSPRKLVPVLENFD